MVEQSAVDPGAVYQVTLRETKTIDSVGTHHEEEASPADTLTPSPSIQHPEPPVEEGDVRTVMIDTLGNQGDGITRVERGFVVIVSDVKPDEEVTIEIESVQSNVAFASVIERSTRSIQTASADEYSWWPARLLQVDTLCD